MRYHLVYADLLGKLQLVTITLEAGDVLSSYLKRYGLDNTKVLVFDGNSGYGVQEPKQYS